MDSWTYPGICLAWSEQTLKKKRCMIGRIYNAGSPCWQVPCLFLSTWIFTLDRKWQGDQPGAFGDLSRILFHWEAGNRNNFSLHINSKFSDQKVSSWLGIADNYDNVSSYFNIISECCWTSCTTLWRPWGRRTRTTRTNGNVAATTSAMKYVSCNKEYLYQLLHQDVNKTACKVVPASSLFTWIESMF